MTSYNIYKYILTAYFIDLLSSQSLLDCFLTCFTFSYFIIMPIPFENILCQCFSVSSLLVLVLLAMAIIDADQWPWHDSFNTHNFFLMLIRICWNLNTFKRIFLNKSSIPVIIYTTISVRWVVIKLLLGEGSN